MRELHSFPTRRSSDLVAIILIIAAIAIPNLLKARIAANQASAVGSLRTIVTAETNYQSTFGGASPTLVALGPRSEEHTSELQSHANVVWRLVLLANAT